MYWNCKLLRGLGVWNTPSGKRGVRGPSSKKFKNIISMEIIVNAISDHYVIHSNDSLGLIFTTRLIIYNSKAITSLVYLLLFY